MKPQRLKTYPAACLGTSRLWRHVGARVLPPSWASCLWGQGGGTLAVFGPVTWLQRYLFENLLRLKNHQPQTTMVSKARVWVVCSDVGDTGAMLEFKGLSLMLLWELQQLQVSHLGQIIWESRRASSTAGFLAAREMKVSTSSACSLLCRTRWAMEQEDPN